MAEGSQQKTEILRTLAAGDVLFKAGDVGDVAYFVESGVIEICTFNGEEYVTLAELGKGSLLAKWR